MTESSPAGPAEDLLLRVDAVQGRLANHAAAPVAEGLTDPDPPTGERWDWGQVWAHLGEFVPYWCGEILLILGSGASDPVPFGRTKTDPARIAAIEADRHRRPSELMDRLSGQLDDLRRLIQRLTPADWERKGIHSPLGVMEMPEIFEEFLVGHLESHADQLDGLRAGRSS